MSADRIGCEIQVHTRLFLCGFLSRVKHNVHYVLRCVYFYSYFLRFTFAFTCFNGNNTKNLTLNGRQKSLNAGQMLAPYQY